MIPTRSSHLPSLGGGIRVVERGSSVAEGVTLGSGMVMFTMGTTGGNSPLAEEKEKVWSVSFCCIYHHNIN